MRELFEEEGHIQDGDVVWTDVIGGGRCVIRGMRGINGEEEDEEEEEREADHVNSDGESLKDAGTKKTAKSRGLLRGRKGKSKRGLGMGRGRVTDVLRRDLLSYFGGGRTADDEKEKETKASGSNKPSSLAELKSLVKGWRPLSSSLWSVPLPSKRRKPLTPLYISKFTSNVVRCLSVLSPLELDVISSRFSLLDESAVGPKETYEDLARRLNKSVPRIKQLEVNALTRLRGAYLDKNIVGERGDGGGMIDYAMQGMERLYDVVAGKGDVEVEAVKNAEKTFMKEERGGDEGVQAIVCGHYGLREEVAKVLGIANVTNVGANL